MSTINLAIAGWTGSAIARGAVDAPDMNLKSAIARSCAGQDLGTAKPYVNGVLLAVRRARGHVGLIRGLDRLLLADPRS